jgi:hypothetical protein
MGEVPLVFVEQTIELLLLQIQLSCYLFDLVDISRKMVEIEMWEESIDTSVSPMIIKITKLELWTKVDLQGQVDAQGV